MGLAYRSSSAARTIGANEFDTAPVLGPFVDNDRPIRLSSPGRKAGRIRRQSATHVELLCVQLPGPGEC